MKWQTNIKSILKYHTILVIYFSFAVFLYNFTANGHFHFNEAGHLVYHFHPLNGDQDGTQDKHTHTGSDFLGIYNYNHSVTFIVKNIFISIERKYNIIYAISFDEQFFIDKHLFSSKSLRAPPEKF